MTDGSDALPTPPHRPLDPTPTSPDFAIILATARDSPFLAEAIASVRAQTVQSWQLLIVDNGAPETSAIEGLIADEPRAALTAIDSRATVGQARNVGVGMTSAPFVTFIDDDDVWMPQRLERHLSVHLSQPAASTVVSGYWHMDGEGRRFGSDWVPQDGSGADMLRGRRPTPVCGALSVRRQAFQAIGGFSPEIPLMSDFELILRLLQHGPVGFVPEVLMGYRRHSANITSTAPANARLRRATMTGMVERHRWAAAAREDHVTAEALAERARRQFHDLGREAGARLPGSLRHGDVADAWADLRWGVRHAPRSLVAGFLRAATRRRRP